MVEGVQQGPVLVGTFFLFLSQDGTVDESEPLEQFSNQFFSNM